MDIQEGCSMITYLKRWGNSLAVRVPQTLLSELNLKENEQVEIKLIDNQLILTPIVIKKSKYQLDDLLDGITLENQQELIDFGKPTNNEEW
jgi:antitoxin MazE